MNSSVTKVGIPPILKLQVIINIGEAHMFASLVISTCHLGKIASLRKCDHTTENIVTQFQGHCKIAVAPCYLAIEFK